MKSDVLKSVMSVWFFMRFFLLLNLFAECYALWYWSDIEGCLGMGDAGKACYVRWDMLQIFFRNLHLSYVKFDIKKFDTKIPENQRKTVMTNWTACLLFDPCKETLFKRTIEKIGVFFVAISFLAMGKLRSSNIPNGRNFDCSRIEFESIVLAPKFFSKLRAGFKAIKLDFLFLTEKI